MFNINNNIIKFIIEAIKPFKIWIIGIIIIGIIWSIDASFRPYLLKIIINKATNIKHQNANELITPTVIYLLMSLLITTIFRFYNFFWLQLNPPLKRHIGDLLLKKMMSHSINTMQNYFAGSLANKLKDVMSGVPDLLTTIINVFFSHSLALIIAVFTLWNVSYKFSALLFLWTMTFIIGSIYFSKRANELCITSAKIRSLIVGQIVDILTNIINIHLFATQQAESNDFKVSLDKYVAADQARDWWFLIMFAFQGFSFVIYQALSFVILISDFKQGTVTSGDFALIATINITIISYLWSLSETLIKFNELIGNITQGLNIVLQPPTLQDAPQATELQVKQGYITFERVQFSYQHQEPLFNDKSVVLKAGAKIGLVGYSGSGKSTFVNLILRLYDVTEGNILIDQQNIKHVTQTSLRQNIAMIPQDPLLFHRSLMENIGYGKITATDNEVISAAKRANAHEFISKLPHGYESFVGERGIKLSGGQRQRIAIARAILKNAPILILDEATSQLDSVTEKNIQDTLWDMMQNKTTIVVAHRLSTLLHMDRILVFDKGKIIEDGSHQQLLAHNGLYKHLWNTQINGFLPEKII